MSQVKLISGQKAATAPASPAANDLWYDSANDLWKRWSGTAWVTAGSGLFTPLVETVNTVSAAGAAQTIPDPATGATISRLTLTAACTLTFPTAAAGKSFTLMLAQDATGSRTVTWPTVLWAGGTAPTLTTTASKRDVFSFVCVDGTNWLGFVSGQNF